MSDKKRLDVVVYEMGHTDSREKARALIMAGSVYVNGQKELKAGAQIKPTDAIEVRGSKMPYVSRGGYKLEKAMQVFPLELTEKVCMDIGASTGGFTDCMLQNGATKVYSIDVGYGQLAWKLRSDSRVVNMERTNFRNVTEKEIPDPIDFASVDVSFISLKIILPVMRERLKNGGQAVCLIKPQFEAGREKVGKKGVVRELSTHIEVLDRITSFAFENGFSLLGLDFSPIKGPEGNIEYLMFIEKSDNPVDKLDISPADLAKKSHEILNSSDKEESNQ